jgi:hypothetical protein
MEDYITYGWASKTRVLRRKPNKPVLALLRSIWTQVDPDLRLGLTVGLTDEPFFQPFLIQVARRPSSKRAI